MEKRIVLGSGKLYCAEFSGEIPTDTELETDANILGLISGGASVKYESESYEAKDDLGIVVKKRLTSETVTLESGIITWNGNTLSKLCSTARVTEAGGKRTVKIGGSANQNGKSYVIRFVHTDSEDGTIRVTIVGTAESGFEFSFKPDEETTIDATFTALPSDDAGTLLIFEETIATE
jgi:hypothetical protein